jgi:4-hydroxy-4-methyl-2-oxoglutarate aldolase
MEPLFERLRALDTTTLIDAAKHLRVVDPALRPIAPGRKLVGRAVTVAANGGLLPVLDGLERAGVGDVLVVDGGGAPPALAGELFASEAQRKGLAGIVIDGCCRDTSELRRIELPFYARGCVPHAAPAGAAPAGPPGPVRCGGVEVASGDVLVGDDDGIVVGTAEQLAAVVDAAEALQATERSILAAIRAGTSLFERLERHEGGLRFKDTTRGSGETTC